MDFAKAKFGFPIRPKAHHNTSGNNQRYVSHKPRICITTVSGPPPMSTKAKQRHLYTGGAVRFSIHGSAMSTLLAVPFAGTDRHRTHGLVPWYVGSQKRLIVLLS